MKIFARLILLSAALLLCACASVKTYKVDAISADTAAGSLSYAIVPADPQVSPNDLRFLESASCVEKALAPKGYVRMAANADAGMIVAIDAAVSEPRSVEIIHNEPVFYDFDMGFHRGMVPVRTRDGRVCFIRAGFWGPCGPGPVLDDRVSTRTYYQKRLYLSAYGNEPDDAGNLPQLWSVIVESYDTDGDLRASMPGMALAAARYAGENTGGQITVRLSPDDADVQNADAR